VRLKISALAATLAVTAIGVSIARADTPVAGTPEEIAAAERAFAADGFARGVGPSFVTWAAPDGIIFRPDPINARQAYTGRPAPGPGLLKWWPAHAAIARSGDLGFDTGPWVFGDDKAHGWFFTVWKKQPDGTWKWMIDHGFDGARSNVEPGSPINAVPVSTAGSGSASAAFAEVKAEEARLASEAAAGHVESAFGARMADEAWVAGLEAAPATTADAVDQAMASRPQTMTMELLGGEASAAGDFAYTYGKARWSKDGKAVEARFVRIWQKQAAGWKLLFDETTPV
jgi:ketosteroid isomerase-like protein